MVIYYCYEDKLDSNFQFISLSNNDFVILTEKYDRKLKKGNENNTDYDNVAIDALTSIDL